MDSKALGKDVFSPIKWYQEQKLLKSRRLMDDRNKLKVLNREEIISYRLPLHEAILRKLNNDGFFHSAEYLKQLIDFQESYRMEAGEDSIIWQRPKLTNQQQLLEHLTDQLKLAEQAHTANRTEVEIDIFLQLATELCFGSENWWWLGHQILFNTMKVCEDYEDDRGRRMALLNYIFGRFLFDNASEPEMALEHLKIAREISAEMSWNINTLFSENGTIFSKACTLIHKIIMKEARRVIYKDPKETLILCEQARKRALEGCYYEGIIDSYILKGNCEIMMNNTEKAITNFRKGLDILDEHDNVDLRCEALKNLGLAYLRHGALDYTLKTLNKLKNFAHQHNKVNYIAQAHKYLGEFYLKEGTAKNATPLLMAAVKMFSQAGNSAEAAKTRNLAAISVGTELMPAYVELIRNSDPIYSRNHKEVLNKLLLWKDSREPFWKDSNLQQLSPISSTQTNLANISAKEAKYDLSETDDFDLEELLDVTRLDNEQMNQGTLTNMTQMVSVSGIEKSGNTMWSPETYTKEEESINFMDSRDKESLSAFVTNIKENKSYEYSNLTGLN